MKAAIELLAAIPESKAARENVQVSRAFWKIFCNSTNLFAKSKITLSETKHCKSNIVQVFKKVWVDQFRVFMDSVDDVVSVPAFLWAVEGRLLQDVKSACRALEAANRPGVRLHSRYGIVCTYIEIYWSLFDCRAAYQRCGRLCDLLVADLDRFEPDSWTDRVLCWVWLLKQCEVLPAGRAGGAGAAPQLGRLRQGGQHGAPARPAPAARPEHIHRELQTAVRRGEGGGLRYDVKF